MPPRTQPRYLYAEDLIDGGDYVRRQFTITKVHPANTIPKAEGGKIDKPVLEFEGTTCRLVLCRTNIDLLRIVTGEQPGDAWHGQLIELGVQEVESFGEWVPAIRVIPPVGTPLRKVVRERLGKKAQLKKEPQ